MCVCVCVAHCEAESWGRGIGDCGRYAATAATTQPTVDDSDGSSALACRSSPCPVRLTASHSACVGDTKNHRELLVRCLVTM